MGDSQMARDIDAILLAQCGGEDLRIDAGTSMMRPLGKADLTERYLGWLNDPDLNRFSRRGGRQFTHGEMAGYVAEANASPNKLLLGVFTRDDGKHLGNILLDYTDRNNGHVEIANLLGERALCRARKLGSVMIDANKHLFHFGFKRLGVRKFLMGNLSPNRAATIKSKKLGAQIEGRLRRHVRLGDDYVEVLRFGLFADEFYERFPEIRDTECWSTPTRSACDEAQ